MSAMRRFIGQAVRSEGTVVEPKTLATVPVLPDGQIAVVTDQPGNRLYVREGGSLVPAIDAGSGFVAKSGDTMTGRLVLPASAAVAGSGLRVPHGVAPDSPQDGDVWTTDAGIFVRVDGATVGPLSDGGGTPDPLAKYEIKSNTPYALTGIAGTRRLYVHSYANGRWFGTTYSADETEIGIAWSSDLATWTVTVVGSSFDKAPARVDWIASKSRYLAVAENGVFVSADLSSWTEVSLPSPAGPVDPTSLNYDHGTTVLLAARGNDVGSGVIYRSTGADLLTWFASGTVRRETNHSLISIVYVPGSGWITHNGRSQQETGPAPQIMRSSNGSTWGAVTVSPWFFSSGGMQFYNPTSTQVVALLQDSLWRSTDFGATWTRLQLPAGAVSPMQPMLTHAGLSRLLALFMDGNDSYLYTSADDGQTWVRGTRIPGNVNRWGLRAEDGRLWASYSNGQLYVEPA